MFIFFISSAVGYLNDNLKSFVFTSSYSFISLSILSHIPYTLTQALLLVIAVNRVFLIFISSRFQLMFHE